MFFYLSTYQIFCSNKHYKTFKRDFVTDKKGSDSLKLGQLKTQKVKTFIKPCLPKLKLQLTVM